MNSAASKQVTEREREEAKRRHVLRLFRDDAAQMSSLIVLVLILRLACWTKKRCECAQLFSRKRGTAERSACAKNQTWLLS